MPPRKTRRNNLGMRKRLAASVVRRQRTKICFPVVAEAVPILRARLGQISVAERWASQPRMQDKVVCIRSDDRTGQRRPPKAP
jgi:hypothetical protein